MTREVDCPERETDEDKYYWVAGRCRSGAGACVVCDRRTPGFAARNVDRTGADPGRITKLDWIQIMCPMVYDRMLLLLLLASSGFPLPGRSYDRIVLIWHMWMLPVHATSIFFFFLSREMFPH